MAPPRSRLPALLALTAAALLAAPGFAVHDPLPGASAAQVPCQLEPVLCPDLVVDPARLRDHEVVLRTFGAGSCSIAEGHVPGPGAHKLLRFTFTTPNLGPGDLVVGAPWEHPEWFVWGPCHRHYHFREYADYRLWTPDGYAAWTALRAALPTMTAREVLELVPDLRSKLVAGHKQGFCVIDLVPVVPRGLVLDPVYWHCGNQGISVGWADEYHRVLDGQWIVVDDVPPGTYLLEAEVNAERLYKETNYGNNAAAIPVQLT